MPYIRVSFFEGKSTETKRELVQALTKETVRVIGCAEQQVHISIEETKKENVAIGGQLMSDK